MSHATGTLQIMRKTIYLTLFIFISIIATTSFLHNEEKGIIDEEISASLMKVLITRTNGASLQMSEVNAGQWDRLHIYPPYTTTAVLEKDFTSLPKSVVALGIDSRDDINLLIFSNGPIIKSAATVSRGIADFSLASRPMVMDRRDAIFTVQTQVGRTVLIHRQ